MDSPYRKPTYQEIPRMQCLLCAGTLGVVTREGLSVCRPCVIDEVGSPIPVEFQLSSSLLILGKKFYKSDFWEDKDA